MINKDNYAAWRGLTPADLGYVVCEAAPIVLSLASIAINIWLWANP